LAVVADTDQPIQPCGACRQVMSEFFHEDVIIILANSGNETYETSISDLLPNSFSL